MSEVIWPLVGQLLFLQERKSTAQLSIELWRKRHHGTVVRGGEAVTSVDAAARHVIFMRKMQDKVIAIREDSTVTTRAPQGQDQLSGGEDGKETSLSHPADDTAGVSSARPLEGRIRVFISKLGI